MPISIKLLIITHRWDKESAKYVKDYETISTGMKALLEIVADILLSGRECTLEIDPTNYRVEKPKEPINWKVFVPGYCQMHWISGAVESTDNDELLSFIENSIYDQEPFSVEINQIDPTPDY